MTYSIIALCPRTRRLGVASATFSIACGRRNESARSRAGISKSQAFYLRQVDVAAVNMLEQGHTPAYIVRALSATDPDIDYRQFGVIDSGGQVAVHTGPATKPWSGHHVGSGFAAYGNVLTGPRTLDGIVAGFLADPGASLERRLLAAIRGGQAAGGQSSDGQPLPERSAWLRVLTLDGDPEIDLRVDLSDDAVSDLLALYDACERRGEATAARGPDMLSARAQAGVMPGQASVEPL